MEKTLKELAKEQATEKDLVMIGKLTNVIEEPYKQNREENLQKLYEYATIVKHQNGIHPYGEVTKIEIEDSFGTVTKVSIKE